MQVLHYILRFTAPAFLGNAEQAGQWRTPPIKALLRQWWRVVQAPAVSFDVATLRAQEARLFGAAADNGGSTKSRIRIRLDKWTRGTLTAWPEVDPKVRHPEVTVAGGMVGSQLYLGYGPLAIEQGRQGTALKANAAIQAGESARLSIAVPDDAADTFAAVLALANLYGTLGGRSRNGWGSFVLTPLDGTPPMLQECKRFQRPWRDALRLDWPHAIGGDEGGPLVWQTRPFNDWKALMERLAEIKIALRTQFKFTSGQSAPTPEPRHWLSYPVTRHSVKPWGNNARLPNQLRFKARPMSDGKVVGVIFHVPHLPPPAFNPDRRAVEDVWKKVHETLDATENLTRAKQ